MINHNHVMFVNSFHVFTELYDENAGYKKGDQKSWIAVDDHETQYHMQKLKEQQETMKLKARSDEQAKLKEQIKKQLREDIEKAERAKKEQIKEQMLEAERQREIARIREEVRNRAC